MTPMSEFKSTGLLFLGLSSMAIALPLLHTLGVGATFFVSHGAEPHHIVAFALCVYLIPAAALLAVEICIRLISRAAARVFVSIVLGLLAGLWAMGMVSSFPAALALSAAISVGVFVGWQSYIRASTRESFKYLGFASPLVIIFFLAFTPVNILLLPESDIVAGSKAGLQTPVVFLILDELPQAAITRPDGEIDEGRLPNFARLAKMSTWYHDTTTVSTQTERAVPAILAGKRVKKDTLPFHNEYPLNLFTLLAPSHTINAIETGTRLCPKGVCGKNRASEALYKPATLFSDAWFVWLHGIAPASLAEKYLPSISSSWHGFQDSKSSQKENSNAAFFIMAQDLQAKTKNRFTKFVSNIRGGTDLDLNYLHLALPHVPWIYLPDGTTYNGKFAPGQSIRSYDWADNQSLVDQGVLRYALQLEYVDQLLGEALDALEQSGRLDETLLIVVSDHGVIFAPGKHRRIPEATTLADVARVPLFIKYPAQKSGSRDTRKIETIDIFPTVIDVLGLPVDSSIDGQSLISPRWGAASRHLLEAGNTISNYEAAMDMSAAIGRMYRVLEQGKSSLEVLTLGESKKYFGTSPEPYAVEEQFSLQLDRAEWYENISLDAGFLPARITGKVNGAKLGTDILLALNGSIAGSGKTYDSTGSISIMLDPRLFIEGANRIDAYTFHDDNLFQITQVNQEWTIERTPENSIIATNNAGLSYSSDDALSGRATFKRDHTLDGWACDKEPKQSPESLLLVDGTRVLSSGFRLFVSLFASTGENDDEDVKCDFTLCSNTAWVQRKSSLTVHARIEGGRLVEIRPK